VDDVERLISSGKPVGYLIRRRVQEDAVVPVDPPMGPAGVALMRHPKGGWLALETPDSNGPISMGMPEVLLVHDGHCVLDLADDDRRVPGARDLRRGDMVILFGKGHVVRMVEDTVLIRLPLGAGRGLEDEGERQISSTAGPGPIRPASRRVVEGGERGLVSMILPTYNERENIEEEIDRIVRAVGDPVEVVVVDDDSPDGTWEQASRAGGGRVKVIRRVKTRGLASAINRGIIESRGDIIGWMDADMSMPASLLPAMISKLAEHDVVIGSRYVTGGGDQRPFLRVLASRLINALATLVLGYGIKDYDSGFIVMHRHVLNRVTQIPTGYGAYFVEFIYTCCRKGLSVLELPYVLTDRTRGKSKSAPSLWAFLVMGLGYVFRIFTARLRKID